MQNDIEKLAKTIRETIDENNGGSIHMNRNTAASFKSLLYHDEELEQPNAIGLYYGSQVIIDDDLKDNVVDIWN